jgi:hypothetical protein
VYILAYIPLGIWPGMVLLEYMANLFLVFWRTSPAFHSGCASLHSRRQWWIRVPFPLPSHQHLLFFMLLMIAILTEMRWNLSVVLICISFMVKDVEHFFICLLGIYTYFFENYPFSSLALCCVPQVLIHCVLIFIWI